MSPELSPRQQTLVLAAKFVSTVFLAVFAIFGLLTLVGVPGTFVKMAAALGGAVPVNLFALFQERKRLGRP